MALYLNEVWLREPSPESFREFIEAFGSLSDQAEQLGLSSDMFRLVAGPWMSIEEAKVVFVFESPDPASVITHSTPPPDPSRYDGVGNHAG